MEIKSTILEEKCIFVAKSLLFRENRQWNTWEPSSECLLKQKELVVAAFAFPWTLTVTTLNLVVNGATHILRVGNREIVLQIVHEHVGLLGVDGGRHCAFGFGVRVGGIDHIFKLN